MSQTDFTNDPYAVYLAYYLNGREANIWGPKYPKTAVHLLAAALGERHYSNRGSIDPWTREAVASYLREWNARSS